MEMLAVWVLAFYAAGYFVLGGADIGVGMALPYLARTRRERGTVRGAITPVFLANEVWLVATAGILTGAFPLLEGELLSGNHTAVVTLLLGWMLRDMGLWLRGRIDGVAWETLWDAAVVAGSWTVVLSWGAIFSAISGLAWAPAMVVVAGLFGAQGLTFAALRLRGTLRERARRLSGASGEGAAFALTTAAMVALVVLAGTRLPLVESAAGPESLALLVPVILAVTPFLVASQVWLWRVLGQRVTAGSHDPLGTYIQAADSSPGS
ncbi:cytochrome d ubiquinol oxidase subunit II [Streptosporangium sp. KLBMP 9127]|nr:cytochrome d ubiquinol oxidase subunit II [Streptosporangium sp. KLBMP 9127]